MQVKHERFEVLELSDPFDWLWSGVDVSILTVKVEYIGGAGVGGEGGA